MERHPYSGKLILFEGGDGTGKSTQAQLAHAWICQTRPETILTKEPYTKTQDGRRVYSGEEIYQVLKGEHARTRLAHMTSEQFQRYFYFPNRIQHHLEVVIPALEAGRVVLSDRGLPSVCYGAANVGALHRLMAEQLEMFETLQLPWPDGIIIYDVLPEVAIARMKASGKDLDQHERLDILERVRKNYLVFTQNWPNCYIIDGRGVPDEVSMHTRVILRKVL